MAIHTPRDKSAKHPHNSQLVSTKISALSFPKMTNFNLFTCGNFHVNNFHSTTYIVNIPCVYYHGIRKANHATTKNCEVKDTRNRKNRDKKRRTQWHSERRGTVCEQPPPLSLSSRFLFSFVPVSPPPPCFIHFSFVRFIPVEENRWLVAVCSSNDIPLMGEIQFAFPAEEMKNHCSKYVIPLTMQNKDASASLSHDSLSR